MKITKYDFSWSLFAYLFKIGSSLFLLPFILKFLSLDDVGIWYVLSSVLGLTLLFDFGFSPTIIRNVTYIYSGIKELRKVGVEDVSKSSKGVVDYKLLGAFIHTTRRIYLLIGFLAFVLLSVVGSFYFYTILRASNLNYNIYYWITWLVFIISTISNLYFIYLNNLLIGRGLVTKAQQAIVFGSLVYVILALCSVYSGFGLLGIVISNFIGTLVNRYIAFFAFFDIETRRHIVDNPGSSKEHNDLFQIVFYNARKMGVVTLGGFLINKAGFFLVTMFFSLSVVAKYGLTMQLISVVSSFAVIYFNTYLPLINTDFISKNNNGVIRNIGVSLFIIVVIFSLALVVFYFFGDMLLGLLGCKITLIDKNLIAVIILIGFLEVQHSVMATILTIENVVPFVYPALISGIVILGLSTILLYHFEASLWFVIIPQAIVQLSYNNWKWPLAVLHKLNINYFALIYQGLIFFVLKIKILNER
jgi:hypothetical protein